MEMNEVYTHTDLETGGPAWRAGSSGGRDGRGQRVPRAFTGVFVGRKGRGRVGILSKLRTGMFEQFQWAWL